jgi:hypothetical protein
MVIIDSARERLAMGGQFRICRIAFLSMENLSALERLDHKYVLLAPLIDCRFQRVMVIKSSLDGEAWTEIDRKTDNRDFKSFCCARASFAVSNSAGCRFIRLTQKDRRHYGDSHRMTRINFQINICSFLFNLGTICQQFLFPPCLPQKAVVVHSLKTSRPFTKYGKSFCCDRPSFAVSNSAECRFIRLAQTGENHSGNDYLFIQAFGTSLQ